MSDERDPETYDDTEFYSTLLKEFLESNSAPGLALPSHSVSCAVVMHGMVPVARGVLIFVLGGRARGARLFRGPVLARLPPLPAPLAHTPSPPPPPPPPRQGPKKRKVVDRRASKGRKIRYQVQEKLVNFMVPQEVGSESLASQLLGNLFGAVV